jgi:hypothetical protein
MGLFHFTDVVQTDRGAGLPNWRVQIVTAGTSTVQPIYSDISGTPILAVSGLVNFAVSDHAGNYDFFCVEGVYDLMIYNDAGVFQRRITYKSMFGAASQAAGLPYLTVENYGALGNSALHNDQPAFAAAAAIMQATGVPILLGPKTYYLWTPIRTTDIAYGYQVADGICLYLTQNFKMTGIAGKTKLVFLNSTGGTNDTVTQNVGGPWRGHGIVFNPATTADYLTLEDFEMDGTKSFYSPGGAFTNAQSDITHKAIAVNPVLGDFKNLRLSNVNAHHFGGELYYIGGFLPATQIEAFRLKGSYSNQSIWNPNGLGKVSCIESDFHDSYAVTEIISGAGHDIIGGVWANGYTVGSIGTQFYVSGYIYSYPNRDTTKAPSYVNYNGLTVSNIGNFQLSAWSKGNLTLIDTQLIPASESYVDADFLIDQGSSTAPIFLSGPATTTTQIPSCPAGVYYPKTSNIRVRARIRRTKLAQTNSVTNISAVQIAAGLIDSASVRVHVEGEVGNVYVMSGTPVTGQVQPLITTGDIIPLGQPYGGSYDTPSANTNYTPDVIARALSPTAVGPIDIGMVHSYLGNPYVPADGQIYTHYHNGTNGNMVRLKANAPLCALPQDRVLANKGDVLQLKYNGAAGVWEEYYFSSSRQTKFYGSASITPASLATATQATIGTVTVTGAAIGDVVVGCSASVSAAGVRLWGDVTASNTVTVYARNDSGSTWDPGATTFAVRVEKA